MQDAGDDLAGNARCAACMRFSVSLGNSRMHLARVIPLFGTIIERPKWPEGVPCPSGFSVRLRGPRNVVFPPNGESRPLYRTPGSVRVVDAETLRVLLMIEGCPEG